MICILLYLCQCFQRAFNSHNNTCAHGSIIPSLFFKFIAIHCMKIHRRFHTEYFSKDDLKDRLMKKSTSLILNAHLI